MTDLWFQAEGKGSDLVLLHSGLSDSRSWGPILPFLTESHRVVRYDARAFGQSPDPTSDYDPIEDAVAVMDAAGVGLAHLVGNSMGATTARAIALLHPERVRSLTLVGPGFPVDAPPEQSVRLMTEWREARSRGDVEAALSVARAVWITGSQQEDRLRELLVRQHPDLPDSLAPPEAIQHVEGISVPVLILVGEQDSPIVLLASEILARRIPRVVLRVIRDARHHPHEDQPDEFARSVSDFLAAVDAAAP
jgi:3-oxoadipate enol-lactonase